MGRGRAFKIGRLLSLLAAGLIGYLLGDWHALVMRSHELSAAQSIALRFPEPKTDIAVADAAADVPTGAANVLVPGEPRLALLSPELHGFDAANGTSADAGAYTIGIGGRSHAVTVDRNCAGPQRYAGSSAAKSRDAESRDQARYGRAAQS